MKRVHDKLAISLSIIVALILVSVVGQAQPTPGDSGLGAASGNVVGGGADIADGIWIWLFLAVIFITYSYFKQLKAMQEEEA